MGAATVHVALLRGINVGGHAKVGMDDLRRVFVALGHAEVRTYIQSGNVVFSSAVDEPSRLVGEIEQRIASDLGVTVTVLLRAGDELAQVVAGNPFLDRGAELSKLHVTFLAERPDAERAAGLGPPAGEADELALVGREVYLHCPNGYGRTKMNNAWVEKRLGMAATTRGWKTVVKLGDIAAG